MHQVRLFYFTSLIAIIISLSSALANENTIVLPLNDWPSQRLLTKIVGKKIEALGYNVDYLPISSVDQIGALRKGIVHLQVELWQSHDDGMYMQAASKGYIDDLGMHRASGREDWWYPDYVEELCPGLPDWKALNSCSEIFSELGGSEKGIYYTGPWSYRDGELIRSLGLNFKIVRLETAELIWEKLRDAKEKKQPIVLLNWTPNWLDVRIKGHFVEFPAFEKKCETDPRWGLNTNMTHDCGNPAKTNIKKAAWPGLKQQWPCVYQLLQKVSFTTEMLAEASALNGIENIPEKQAIRAWLDKYAEQNQAWLNFECPNT
jgi:glycine betaine/proline transport system substrate-binding protein